MSTLFRAADGFPTYNCAGEVLYDAAGQAQFYFASLIAAQAAFHYRHGVKIGSLFLPKCTH
jgi:hypothetical protein